MRRALLALVVATALPPPAPAAGSAARPPRGDAPAPPPLTCFIALPAFGIQVGPIPNVSPAAAGLLSTVIGRLGGSTVCT